MTSINLRYVVRMVGVLVLLMGAAMVLSLGWAIYDYYYRESIWRDGAEVIFAFLAAMGIGGAVGGLLYWQGSNAGHFGKKEALLLVVSAWFFGAALGAIPFYLWATHHDFLPAQDRAFLSFMNCYFEAMSGLTTTGATVLANIETIPRGLLFWRAFTHWMGGLGIVVLFVAVLPSFAGGTKNLFRFESTGLGRQGTSANIRDTTRSLLYIYLLLTFSQVAAIELIDPSVSFFSAVTHAFATLGTGGYSVYNASLGAVSPSVQWVTIVFMLLGGINFGLYQQAFSGKFREALRDTELRGYLAMVAIASLIIMVTIHGTGYSDMSGNPVTDASWWRSLRDAAFQATSIQTTTGYATANFDQWGLIPKAVIVLLMFIGGCGGSTAGGIKVIRIIGAFKIMAVELERAFRPSVLRPVRVGTHNVEYHQRISVLAYVLGILVLFGIGTTLLLVTEAGTGISGTTAMMAAIGTLNNVGPGLGAVGPVANYAWFSGTGKFILCILMALGRLEVFAVLVVFMPRFWRSH